MTWTAEKQAARYARLKDEGRCVGCGGVLLPEWGELAHCPTCLEREAAQRVERERNETAGARAERLKTRAAAARRRYAADPEGFRQYIREQRQQKKEAGICLKCPAPAADDSLHCVRHRETERKRQREAARARRERMRAAAQPTSTVEDAGDLRPARRAA